MTIEAVGAAARAGERQHLSLDGTWRFRLEGAGDWRQIKVPAPWQAEFPDLRHASGRAIYARQLSIPQSWRSRQLVLRFGAVNYLAEIRLNGRILATHEGGYLPFEVVLPENTPAERALEVHVTLPTGDRSAYPDFPFGEIPHGKQSWYGPLGGIWQSVQLEARNPAHLSHVAIRADAPSGAIRFELSVPAPALRAEIGITVFDAAGRAVAAGETTVSGPTATLELEVADPLLWSPDAPNLYQAEIQLARSGELLDRRDESFGFRSIETRDGKFLLNGEPLYLRGALDQDYYPQDICTPPSLAFLEDQARKAKELGLNLLRCHIKVPDPRYYEVADRLGLLVWTEIPNVQYFTERSAQRLRDTMEGILHRDGNHPSIIAWTIINEDWGTRLIENADHRAWLKQTYDWLKAKDPTRLVVDNSACIPNFHVKTDINDYHYYRSVPERRGEWEKLTEEFAAAASWTWSPHGDAERRGDEPLVVSEFGVWGLPDPRQLVDTTTGKEPWWFETGGNWGDGVAYPHGAENRFKSYHLDTVFGSFDNFIAAVQWYQFGNLKYQIESMRAYQSIMGYVITELTDVHWESNGLLDLERNPRVFHSRFADINADTVIVPRLAHHAAYAGDTVTLDLKIAAGGKPVPHARLLWTLESLSGTVEVPATEPLAVSDLGAVQIALPPGQPRVASIGLELTADGQTLARNSIDVAVYAPRQAGKGPMLATTDPGIEAFLRGLGYIVTSPDQAQVIVKHALGPDDIEMLRHGAHYLVLADDTAEVQQNLRTDPPRAEPPTMPAGRERPRRVSAEQQLPNIGLHRRDGTMWRGDWIASFSWLRRDGAFASMPGGPMLDVSFDRVVPHHVMTGFRSWEYQGLIHAGVVVGWLHKPAATVAERQVGKGWLVATTFRLLADRPGADPVAAALLDGLITLAAERKEA